MAANYGGGTGDIAIIPDNIAVTFLPEYSNLSKRALDRGLNYYCQAYIHKLRIYQLEGGLVRVTSNCHRSMKKGLEPHSLHLEIDQNENTLSESFCSCKAG